MLIHFTANDWLLSCAGSVMLLAAWIAFRMKR
jgi:hypothetical protein